MRITGLHRAGFKSRHAEESRNDPGLCTTCHSEQTCRDCHEREHVAAGAGQLGAGGGSRSPHPPGWLSPGRGGGDHGRSARLDPAACASCHGGAGEQLCIGCHRVGGPGGNPHGAGFSSVKDKTRDLPCRLCHQVGRDEAAAPRRRADGRGARRGGRRARALSGLRARAHETPSFVPLTWAEVRDTPGHAFHVGKKAVPCTGCHAETDGSFERPGAAICAKCHAGQAAKTHAGDAASPTSCLTCHAFEKEATPCVGCHAKPQGRLPAMLAHGTPSVACTSCHDPHADPPARQADCASCHADVTFAHGRLRVTADVAHAPSQPFDAGAAKGACTDCHAPHTKGAAARATCVSCHEDKPHGARPSGHEACVTCHAPHDFERKAVKGCASCHAREQGAVATAKHSCTGCHAPHDATTPRSCATRHASTRAFASTKVAAHADCRSCHAPHDPKGSPPEAACGRCHTGVHPAHSNGKADRCIDCHTPHPEDRSVVLASTHGDARACTSCHAAPDGDTSFHAGNLTCTSCHAPHGFDLAGAAPAICARCHAPEATAAHASKGHGNCSACHGAVHRPTKAPACGSCHAAEAKTAPAGHATCTKCHAPHNGARLASATCGACHAKENATPHAKVQGGCATCHRPHGPSGVAAAPSCASCHASPPGLHRATTKAGTPAHGTCATCHASHAPPRDDRVSCTSCHADRRDHQPAAKRCSGCHVFGH